MLPILYPSGIQIQLDKLGYASVYENESSWTESNNVIDYRVLSYKTALKLLRLNSRYVWVDSALQNYWYEVGRN